MTKFSKIQTEILSSTKILLSYPEMHPLDKYRINNDGTYRAYELFKYRISYKIKDEDIIILRFRHTSMEPKDY